MALGGTLAEELIYREISNGATSDLEQASRIARSMVKEFGMSRLGRVNFHEQRRADVPPRRGGRRRAATTASRRPARSTWKCARSSTTPREEVRGILQARRAALEAVAQRLIEKEVIDGAELRQMLDQHGPEAARNGDAIATVLEPGGLGGEPCIHSG